MTDTHMGEFIPTWAGECSAWDCDGLGHMNMRHYVTKVSQARKMMMMLLGLETAFTAGTPSTIRVRQIHIKYLAEARPDDPLRVETAILDHSLTHLQLCHMMYHADTRLAATIVEWVDHIYLPTMAVFNWPKRVLADIPKYHVSQPAPSKPRGFKYSLQSQCPTSEQLHTWGMTQIGLGVFQADEVEPHGIIKPEACFGRVTETVGQFPQAWPEMYDTSYREAGGSAALLEALMVIHAPPRAGQAYHFYSALKGADTYTRKLVHHVIDPFSGTLLFSKLGIGCAFNLKTRKLTKMTDSQLNALLDNARPDVEF